MSDYMNGTGIQYHLRIKKGDVGKYVILPGDPKRVPVIAGFLDDAERLYDHAGAVPAVHLRDHAAAVQKRRFGHRGHRGWMHKRVQE